MSTILDALRKLQRERAPRDLRESVLGDEPFTPIASPRWPRWVAMMGLLVLGVGVGAWYAWPTIEAVQVALFSSEEEPDGAAQTPQRPAPPTRAQPSPATSDARVKAAQAARADRARERAERVRAAAEQRAQAKKERARAKAAEPTPAPSTVAEAAAPTPRARAQATPPAPPEKPEAASAPEPEVVPPQVVLDSVAKRSPPRPVPPVERTEQPVVPPTPVAKPERGPAPRIDTALVLEGSSRRLGDPDERLVIAPQSEALGFPKLSLETVRWHPDSERRTARMLLDDTRPIDAREGDIVGGVEVYRIDPGAVELRIGDARRRLAIGQ